MQFKPFPVIDMAATGRNIVRLRKERGMTVRDLQAYFGFEEPQAIYKWQCGKSLPSVDNLYALGALLNVPMEEILVPANLKSNISMHEQQAEPCCSHSFSVRLFWTRQEKENTSTILADVMRLSRASHQQCARKGFFISCWRFYRLSMMETYGWRSIDEMDKLADKPFCAERRMKR